MAKRKLSERQQNKVEAGRQMKVYKRDDMLQHSRHDLSIREQKSILYAISRIKPTDTAFDEYTFELKDFYALCGLKDESYNELKSILIGLKSKSWWVTIDDEGTESAVSWFNVVRTNKRSGKVTIKFHEDMMPYLLKLAEQGAFYTAYNLKYVLPMSSQYSPRLYELLKSYQKNNLQWFFETEELKRNLDCQNYKNFNDFKRFAIEPAVKEINKYTDINVAYDTETEGRKVTRVIFYMAGKSKSALLDAEREATEKLDGQMDFDEVMAALNADTVKKQFQRENPIQKEK